MLRILDPLIFTFRYKSLVIAGRITAKPLVIEQERRNEFILYFDPDFINGIGGVGDVGGKIDVMTSVEPSELRDLEGIGGINIIDIEISIVSPLKYLKASAMICIPEIIIYVPLSLIPRKFRPEMDIGIKSVGYRLGPLQLLR
jgi:hypothetical protein